MLSNVTKSSMIQTLMRLLLFVVLNQSGETSNKKFYILTIEITRLYELI
jgi:hypothetical protein